MPWTPPSDPVSATVITVAYAVANLLTQIRWLRLMTGNADPPGSAYVVVADSGSATSWKKIPSDALADGAVATAKLADGAVTAAKIADGAVVAELGYTPVNKVGDTMTGQLRVFRTQGASPGAFDTAPLVVQSPDASANPSETAGIGLHRANASGIYLYHGGASGVNYLRFITNTGLGASVWHSANMGAGSLLDADTVRTRLPGAAAGNLAVLDAAGKVALAVAADSATSATNATNATNAGAVGGRTPTATATANAIPIADGAGKLDAWISPSGLAGFPTGVIAAVPSAAQIPSGFTRYSALDGRMPVGAGTTFGVTFAEGTSGGSSWAHTHSTPPHQHSGAPMTIGGSAAATGSTDQANVSTPGTAFALGGHTHSVSGSVGGNTANDGNSTAGSTTWTIPCQVVVWIIKS